MLVTAQCIIHSAVSIIQCKKAITSHRVRTFCQTVRRCRQGWRKYQPHLRSGTTILTCLSKLLLLSLCHITTVFSKIQNSCGLVMEEREAGSILYKCLFWLRSLITLHLNQRSQLECDWRWESQLANIEKFQNPTRDICLFVYQWCWCTNENVIIASTVLGGRKGGREGGIFLFSFVRLVLIIVGIFSSYIFDAPEVVNNCYLQQNIKTNAIKTRNSNNQ